MPTACSMTRSTFTIFTQKSFTMPHHLHLCCIALCLTLLNFTSDTWAEDEPVRLQIGDEAPTWSDLVGTDDKMHSLSDLHDKQVVVVCFTCNSCPYSVDYEDRMIEFHRKFRERKEGIALIAINANLKPTERLDKMKERKSEGVSVSVSAG